jgi:hypothetical protein
MKVKASDIGKKLVKKASKLPSPVESLKCVPEKSHLSNGYDFFFHNHHSFRDEIRMEFYWGTHLSKEQFDWIFKLFSTNMEAMYRKSEWGYDDVRR